MLSPQPSSHTWGDCVGLGSSWLDWAGRAGGWDDVDCREHAGTSCACRRPDI